MQEKEYRSGNKLYKLKDFKKEFEEEDRKNGLITCSYKVELKGEVKEIKFKLPYSPDNEDAFIAAFEKEIENQVAKYDKGTSYI